MGTTCTTTPKLSDYPLWRLLVMLDDAERTLGASSESAQIIANEVQRKLRGNRPAERKAVADAR